MEGQVKGKERGCRLRERRGRGREGGGIQGN